MWSLFDTLTIFFMKSKLVLITLLFAGLVGRDSFAQSFIVNAGFSLAEVKEKADGALALDYDMKPGFHAGISAELPVNAWLSFVPGLLYSNKGAKIDQTFFGAKIKGNFNLHYLDIPLTVKASGRLGDDAKVFGVLGPYVGLGLAGKVKGQTDDGQGGVESSSEKVSWGTSEDDQLKRLEMGATIGAGVEYKSYLISINYDYGISNIAPSNPDNGSARNRVLCLTLGYRFGGR